MSLAQVGELLGWPTFRPSPYHSDLTVTGSASARADFAVSFDALLNVVRRMIAARRIRDDGESAIAGRLWSIVHGAVMLEIARLLRT